MGCTEGVDDKSTAPRGEGRWGGRMNPPPADLLYRIERDVSVYGRGW
jgi:hypothetical protein